MLMNAVLAVALGLAPVRADQPVQVIQYKASDYAGLTGSYAQKTDKRGLTHLRGFAPRANKAFDLTIDQKGRVEGTVGESYVTFTITEAA